MLLSSLPTRYASLGNVAQAVNERKVISSESTQSGDHLKFSVRNAEEDAVPRVFFAISSFVVVVPQIYFRLLRSTLVGP